MHQWHNIQTKFKENPTSYSQVTVRAQADITRDVVIMIDYTIRATKGIRKVTSKAPQVTVVSVVKSPCTCRGSQVLKLSWSQLTNLSTCYIGAECQGRVVNTPARYSGGHRFKYQPGDQLS
jgi:hypothetical protein